ncbi:TKL protein kinase [Saprolegnia diclina VS20]|uniref:TKL protein kinase n=1 Tax=Saprolegnia diclina (strain VS20) TaxID=1156394 RepID=T0QZI6_SAPDV|nr:TKL protein kinase [Saprolegnia diclina VS20]EQC40126.1 TKL protein kinase [Saprolegnia diclina VS20]|eukprot:XP_008606600.1 TKL protein kinase [Saprolegnia diclina VS20]
METARLVALVHGLAYGAAFLLAVVSVAYLRQQRSTAWRGSSGAARRLILPSFEPMLWGFAAVSGMYATYFCVTLSCGYAGPGPGPYASVYNEAIYHGEHFHVVFVALFLYQKSVSAPAILRTLVLTLLLLVSPIGLMGLASALRTNPDTDAYVFQLQYAIAVLARFVLVVLFLRLACRPLARANTTVVRELGVFALVFYALGAISTQLSYHATIEAKPHLATWSLYVLMTRACWSMLAPFFIWRVLIADTAHWRGLSVRALHLDTQRASMQEVMSAEGLHILLEMHRRDLIDFAHLEWHHRLGAGGSATVYRGTLHSSLDVAIKVYTPQEISEAVVAEFSHEVGFWAVLRHPNIVSFYGLCVCPPMICLVAELCRGSLDDLLSCTTPLSPLSPLVELCYMLDAARAVAYLHSFSPPLLHRDIKATNYLLDASNNRVKLSDFGESRVADVQLMSVRGTVEYMAPEMIDGKRGAASYATASDVFSLSMTLWDILHPRQCKYPRGTKNHMHVFTLVLDGTRPPLRDTLSPVLRQLLVAAWAPAAIDRPSAASMVTILASLLEDETARLAVTLERETTLSGADLVDALVDATHLGTRDKFEAVRVGNALLETGHLHEVKHVRGFHNSSRIQYTWQPAVAPRRSSLLSFALDDDGSCKCALHGQGLGIARKRAKRRHRLYKKQRSAVEMLLDPETDDETMMWGDDVDLRDSLAQ